MIASPDQVGAEGKTTVSRPLGFVVHPQGLEVSCRTPNLRCYIQMLEVVYVPRTRPAASAALAAGHSAYVVVAAASMSPPGL